ncbi:GGDEF domain-containing protein [Kaarinaea lacus]
MAHPYCTKYGFDDEHIRSRLEWLDLCDDDHIIGKQLQEDVITPNVQAIIDSFYTYLNTIEEARKLLSDEATLKRLKKTQMDYLLNLGIHFDRKEYFESRLRIGQAHAWVGLGLNLYLCSYRKLTQLIADHIPGEYDLDKFKHMCVFMDKITALDMSLAVETYHVSRVRTLEESLDRAQVQENQLRIEASTDALTGFYNHEYILAKLKQAMTEDARAERPTSIMMADLDHFKKINDTHGHLVGDKVLVEVARRLSTAVRDFDSLGRYGGEEFLIVLKGTPLSTAITVAERIRTHIAAGPITMHGLKVQVTISIGVGVIKPGEDVEDFIHRADKALYEAKSAGRNCVKFAE